MIFVAPSKEERRDKVASQGYVYSLTGSTRGCYKYSVATDTWSTIASIPENPRQMYTNFSAVALDGESRYIFVINKAFSGIYDTYADKWNSLLVLE